MQQDETKRNMEPAARLQQILQTLARCHQSLELDEKVSLSTEAISLLRQPDANLGLDHAQVLATIAKLEEIAKVPAGACRQDQPACQSNQVHRHSWPTADEEHQVEIHAAILADLAATDFDADTALQDLLESASAPDNLSDAQSSNRQTLSLPGSFEKCRSADQVTNSRLPEPLRHPPLHLEETPANAKSFRQNLRQQLVSLDRESQQYPKPLVFEAAKLSGVTTTTSTSSPSIHRPLAPPPPLFNPAIQSLSTTLQASTIWSSESEPEKGAGLEDFDSTPVTKPSITLDDLEAQPNTSGSEGLKISLESGQSQAAEHAEVEKLDESETSKSLSSDKKKELTFPGKVYGMLMDAEKEGMTHIVSFTPSGRALIIHKPDQFVKEIVPRYFEQTKLTSFQRTLRAYGFERIPRGPEEGAYAHADFQRGQPDLAQNMKRIKRGASSARSGALDFDSFY